MVKRLLSLVLLLTFLVPATFAQPIYEWADEKGQRHFSNFPPAGVTAKTRIETDAAPESSPITPGLEPDLAPAPIGKSDDKAVAKTPYADLPNESLIRSTRNWLLAFPPPTRVKVDNRRPFLEWIPKESFDSEDACTRAREILIRNAWVGDWDWIAPEVAGSVCIPASNLVIGKEADLLVVVQQFEIASPGFSSVLLFGKVFNRGLATARNVVAKYRIRSSLGSVLMLGDVATSPGDIPGLAFGEFRTPSIAGWNATELIEQIEVDWARK